MVGIRHSVATATAFLKTTLPVKEGRFHFISHKFTASNLRYQARRMNNRSYVTEQTTALHLIYQKFNQLRRKHPLFPWQGTVLIVALATIVCRVSAANRTCPRTSVQQTLHQISYSFRCKQCANCRGEITPTAVVHIVHTLYIHIWILPLSAKLVHIELLLTHKLATVNLWLLIAAYEQSLICYRAQWANIHTFLAHIPANIC